MTERPLEQQIEFARKVLEISEREAAKEVHPGVFTAQAARIKKELEDLEFKLAQRRAEGFELQSPRLPAKRKLWNFDDETYPQYLRRRAKDPNITRERRRQLLLKAKRYDKKGKKHDKSNRRSVRQQRTA